MEDRPSLTERLSTFLVATQSTDLPPSVVDDAKYYTLDWLGSAIAGTVTEPGRMLLAHARAGRTGGHGHRPVGTAQRRPPSALQGDAAPIDDWSTETSEV
jgi:2-methylcitrate dehydratase PrpD